MDNDEEIIEKIDHLSFQTDFYLEDIFESCHAIKNFEIKPVQFDHFNFTQLSCLLNQLTDFKIRKRETFKKLKGNEDFHSRFHFIHKNDDKIYIVIKIGENNIKVTASYLFVKTYFTKQTYLFISDLRQWGKIRKNPVLQDHIAYLLQFNDINDGTNSIYFHKPAFLCSINDFSTIFLYFVENIQKVGLPYMYDTFQIHDVFTYFFYNKGEIPVTNFDRLKDEISGFVLFDVHKSKIKKRLVKIRYKEEDVYITGGVYIAPYAQSLLQENKEYISGLLLDTTFKIFPYYVTSILMVSIMNTGIPISFSFGKTETKELYEKHFSAFKNEVGIDLSIYKFESDQGVALQAIFKDKHIDNYICLRHLLASIKYNQLKVVLQTISKILFFFIQAYLQK